MHAFNIITKAIKVQTSVGFEALFLCTRRVAAAPTTVAAIATEAAVSGRADVMMDSLFPCSCDFISTEEQNRIQSIQDDKSAIILVRQAIIGELAHLHKRKAYTMNPKKVLNHLNTLCLCI